MAVPVMPFTGDQGSAFGRFFGSLAQTAVPSYLQGRRIREQREQFDIAQKQRDEAQKRKEEQEKQKLAIAEAARKEKERKSQLAAAQKERDQADSLTAEKSKSIISTIHQGLPGSMSPNSPGYRTTMNDRVNELRENNLIAPDVADAALREINEKLRVIRQPATATGRARREPKVSRSAEDAIFKINESVGRMVGLNESIKQSHSRKEKQKRMSEYQKTYEQVIRSGMERISAYTRVGNGADIRQAGTFLGNALSKSAAPIFESLMDESDADLLRRYRTADVPEIAAASDRLRQMLGQGSGHVPLEDKAKEKERLEAILVKSLADKHFSRYPAFPRKQAGTLARKYLEGLQ